VTETGYEFHIEEFALADLAAPLSLGKTGKAVETVRFHE
jgi:hypothetical protein